MSHLVGAVGATGDAREYRPEEIQGFVDSVAQSGKELVMIDSPTLMRAPVEVDFRRLLAKLQCGVKTIVLVLNVYGKVAKTWCSLGANTTELRNMDLPIFFCISKSFKVTIVSHDRNPFDFAFRFRPLRDRIIRITERSFSTKNFVEINEFLASCQRTRRPNRVDARDVPDVPAIDAVDTETDAEITAEVARGDTDESV